MQRRICTTANLKVFTLSCAVIAFTMIWIAPQLDADVETKALTQSLRDAGYMNDQLALAFETRNRRQLRYVLGDKYSRLANQLNNGIRCLPNLTVAIFVHSEPHHFELRDAIRGAWGNARSLHDHNMQVFFMIGITKYRYSSPKLTREMRFRDVITIPVIENYGNLTLKTVGMLLWIISSCPSAKYVLKIDDDSFLNMTNFLRVMEKLQDNFTETENGFIYGSPLLGGKPERDPSSKYYTPFISYTEERFPFYVCGAAYVISSCALQHLLTGIRDDRTPLVTIEDVYISGIVRQITNVSLVFDDNFNQVYRSGTNDVCMNCSHLVTIHRANPSRQHKLFSNNKAK